MKKFIKFISLIMTVVMLVLTFGSCSAIKFAIMTEPARAIYLYEQMQLSLGTAYSYNVVTDMTIDQTLGNESKKSEYKIEVLLSDYGEDTMKYVERNYETVNGTPQLQGVFGFSDGKMFISREDNNMLSKLDTEAFINFMGETSSDDTYFDMSILNCENSSYIKDDGIYRVYLSEFYGEAEPCLLNLASNLLGINKGLLTFKAYSVEAELDKDYYPISEKEVLEVEANFGAEGVMSLKLTMNTSYLNIDETVKVNIPDLIAYRVISDLRPVMLASSAYKARSLESDGAFSFERNESDIINGVKTQYSFTYDIRYGGFGDEFGYTITGRAINGSSVTDVKEEYSDGILKSDIDFNGQDYDNSSDVVSAEHAHYKFVSDYLYTFNFDIDLVDTVEVINNDNGTQKIKIQVNVNDERIVSRFFLDEKYGSYKVDYYEYIFVFNEQGEIASCTMQGASSGDYSSLSSWTVTFADDKNETAQAE
ncbi:MAG: hypothetical protein J6A83_06075 [Clostridia bacterium]|nr:hypothetical protein [Clostridia bacterium]